MLPAGRFLLAAKQNSTLDAVTGTIFLQPDWKHPNDRLRFVFACLKVFNQNKTFLFAQSGSTHCEASKLPQT